MSTITQPTTEELIEQLYKIDGKAEIVDGRIVHISPTGDAPSSAGGAIYASLRLFAKNAPGRAYPDNAAFLANLPNRKSFSPDASYYTGPRAGMKFLPQPPDFAAEVRSERDYGPAAERAIVKKRADYFAAGTKVVWDVDLDSDDVVRVYRNENPDSPTIYCRGDVAEAEPAIPGWKMPVDDLFDSFEAMDRPYLKESFPALRDELAELLDLEGERDLIPQLNELQIYGRCQCESKSCSTFYTAPPPEGSYGPDHKSIRLSVDGGYLILDVVAERIVCVEVLDRPDIEKQLKTILS